MWDLPGAGIKPVSLALAGRFLTTGPPSSCLFDDIHTIRSILMEINPEYSWGLVGLPHVWDHTGFYVLTGNLVKISFVLCVW